MKNRTYRYMKYPALYPFGYGLTYTEFQYHDPVISTTDLTADGIHIEGCVSNTGSTFGTETCLLYTSQRHFLHRLLLLQTDGHFPYYYHNGHDFCIGGSLQINGFGIECLLSSGYLPEW